MNRETIRYTQRENHKISVLFPLAGRRAKFQDSFSNNFPREFFYGALDYATKHGSLQLVDSRRSPANFLLRQKLFCEHLIRRKSGFPVSLSRVHGLRPHLTESKRIISFTDFLSLGLGISNSKTPFNAKMIGGFHGLSDVYYHSKPQNREKIRLRVMHALEGLDHLFFVGEKDREHAIKLFDIDRAKTLHFKFGVDTEFWKPNDCENEDFILSVGNDINRDYQTLINACGDYPLKIVSKSKWLQKINKNNIEIISGSLHKPALSDEQLRELYWRAKFIIIPIKDVWQPSGQSVALQAMACGKTVVISNFKGLWDRKVFSDRNNCLLVKPGDAKMLRNTVASVYDAHNECQEIGNNARLTCEQHFTLERMNSSFSKLASL